MDNDFKMVLCFMAVFVALPILGLIIQQWHQYDCRMELAKAGRPVAEIVEICK
jgi:hypothetical protein